MGTFLRTADWQIPKPENLISKIQEKNLLEWSRKIKDTFSSPVLGIDVFAKSASVIPTSGLILEINPKPIIKYIYSYNIPDTQQDIENFILDIFKKYFEVISK